MSSPADTNQHDDTQVAVTIRGRAITMSKRTSAVIVWTVVVAGVACGAAATSVIGHYLGWWVSILLVASVAAFAISYTERTNREIRIREADKEVVGSKASNAEAKTDDI
ncbi:hypothetical protein [Candidatus Poriferisocius sp.]|uniref:hypothetical protein n=1 Tax=Candidatus Poriferisocius sp. TaxID=3101276 RepID=UPI003B013090